MTGKGSREVDKVRELVRAQGASAAYKALVEVCEDKKAPAPARATAGVALFRAAGMFEKTEMTGDKALSEMTAEELYAAAEKIIAGLNAEDGDDAEDGIGDSVLD